MTPTDRVRAALTEALWTVTGEHGGELLPDVTATDTRWEVAAQRLLAAPSIAALVAVVEAAVEWRALVGSSRPLMWEEPLAAAVDRFMQQEGTK